VVAKKTLLKIIICKELDKVLIRLKA